MNDEKLWKIFSVYIRLRDTNEEGIGRCFTCPRYIHWKKGDAGHGIPRQYKATKFDEKNNHLQCKLCNGFEGGVREKYKEEVNKRYGPQAWDLLELKSRSVYRWSQFEIDVLEKHYKKEVEKLLLTKNFTLK